MSAPRRKTISIVTPCLNEREAIAECYANVRKVFADRLPEYGREHIFCDNASTDGTVDVLKEIAARDPAVRVIVNSRNFGILNNTYNGVMNAGGDAVVLFLPADLQDPPELIPRFVRHWEAGYEVVFGIRAKREEGLLIRSARRVYYRLISRLSYVTYPPDVGDFQLVDRKVHAAMKRFDDAMPFMRMMTFECGFKSIGVPYTWRSRTKGRSKNRLSHLVDQGMLGIVSFSTVPIRLCTMTGLLLAGASLAYALFVFVQRLVVTDMAARGVPTLIVALFFFSGVQLIFLGLVGEYILAIYNQVRRRPYVIERERIGFPPEDPPAERAPDRGGGSAPAAG